MIAPSTGKSSRGIALVITLSMLVIATILVLGFTASMRTERHAAASIANEQNAELLAQAAVDHAISILDQNIPQPHVPSPTPAPPAPIEAPYTEYTRFGGGSVADVSAVNWVTQPGLLTTIARHTATNTDTIKQIPLSSNPATTYSSNSDDADVNPRLLNGTANVITQTNQELRVAWVPVLQDPTAAPSAANRIVGRYGFWMDDESTKVNINTAYGKTSTMNFAALTPGTITVNSAIYPLGHPSSVNLDIFGSLDRSGIATAVGNRGGLLSIDDIKPFVSSGTPDDFVNQNKFDLTSFSTAPEFNVFGKSKLYFMRNALPGQLGFPLFQFFRDRDGPNYFPSVENDTGADRHATYYTAVAISNYLRRTDWPGMPVDPADGQPFSFAKKWDRTASGGTYSGLAAGDMGRREADQVAWNLISLGSFSGGDFTGVPANQISGQYYQLRNAASAGETGFVSVNRPNSDVVIGPSSGKAMLPAFPVPLVNEVSLVLTPHPYALADGTQKYRIEASLNVELWLPPGYPSFDFAQSRTTIGMTYLSYHVTQASPGTANAQQEDTKYVDGSAAPNDNGIRKLWIQNNSGTMAPGQYLQLTTGPGLAMYIRNGTGFSDAAIGAEDFTTTGLISVNFRMRLFALTQQRSGSSYGTKYTSQLIPVWDRRDPGTTAAPTSWDPATPSNPPAALAPPGDDPNDYIDFTFTLDPSSFSNTPITRSLEVADPRMGGLGRVWQQAPNFTNATAQAADTLGRINNATTVAGYNTTKLAFVDLTSPGPASNHPSTGFVSVVPTGMQRGIAGATPKFQPSGTATTLPDWLLLDLVAPNVVAPNYRHISYMNATAGKINVNSAIWPNSGKFSLPARFVPLQALLQNMRANSTVIGSTPPSGPSGVVTAINAHTLSTTGGTSYGAPQVYDYDGEVAEIQNFADVDAGGSSSGTDWDKESIIRNLASSITTKSNVFTVWGVAQTVKKNPANNDPATNQPKNPGVFETKAGGAAADDVVTGEKRFQAVIERYVWPGADSSPGNAHVTGSGGSYDNVSSNAARQPGYAPPYSGGSWELIDGPDVPTYPIPLTPPSSDAWTVSAPNFSGSTMEASNNPARALMKYRVIYFRYLTE
jgi:hypothetical protein